MRIAVLLVASALVGGCSQGLDGDAEQPALTCRRRPSTTSVFAAPSHPPRRRRPTAREGAPIADVIAFIEAGRRPIAQYHSATRDGMTQSSATISRSPPVGHVELHEDTENFGGALACLVDLTDPPPRPPMYTAMEGRLGRLRRIERRDRFTARRSRPLHRRQWRRAALRRRAGLRRLPLPRRPRRLFCVNYAHRRPRGSATRASSRSAVCRRRHRLPNRREFSC